MTISTMFIIAVALAIDAFAVALASGAALPTVSFRHTFRLAWHFGLFQSGMTAIGWLGGLSFRPLIENIDHWLAFGLLAFVGGRMIFEAFQSDNDKHNHDPTKGRTLIILSVATSIDALAVGLSLAMLKTEIFKPVILIGLVAIILTAIGLHLGHLLGTKSKLGEKSEIIGGLVLISIGLKILHEHGVY